MNRPLIETNFLTCYSLACNWRERDTRKGFTQRQPGCKGAPRALGSEFINRVGHDRAAAAHAACVHDEQITCAVKRQALCAGRYRAKRCSRVRT